MRQVYCLVPGWDMLYKTASASRRPCGNFQNFQVTDLLRMVCLTEDSAYLAKFLEEILELC